MCAASSDVSVRLMGKELSAESVGTSAATRPTAASAITPRIRRARNERLLPIVLPRLGFQHVPRPPHRPDQRRPGGVELPAEIADVRLDDVRVAAEVVTPDMLEDLPLREDAPRIEHE